MAIINIRRLVFTLSIFFLVLPIDAQVGIGTITPDPNAALEVSSIDAGILIPRMTQVQRDAIVAPPEGLHIYNITTNTTDIFSDNQWKSVAFRKESNLVYVYALDDLPAPMGSEILLDGTKMYIFSGFVDISPYYLI